MKGISEILVVILIAIIVVALIGLTYIFAASLFQTTMTATTTATTTVTGNMQKIVYIISVNCYNTSYNNYFINFTLRNSGSATISSQMSAVLDGADISTASIVAGSSPVISVANDTLSPSQERAYSYIGTQSTHAVLTRTLMITTPAGSLSESLFNCPT